jgi:hypothetical protein
MNRPTFIPVLSFALGATLLGAIRISVPAPEAPARARHSGMSSGTVARALAAVLPSTRRRNGDDDHAAIKRRVLANEAGTYISEIIRGRDSALARWPDRHGIPLTVWVQPQSRVHDFVPAFAAQTRLAFQEWGALHLPVQFSFVDDSADAEVHVNWIDHFNEPISGRTRWSRDDDWMITDANITLAVHHFQGEQLDQQAMHAMALHEIGHLLGLDHTKDSLSIMAPRVRVRQLSDMDRATVRLLYTLPAGPLR